MNQKMNETKEPCCLTRQRTDEGRDMRRKGIDVFRHREYIRRDDGICNTLTTVTKDAIIAEPVTCAMRGRDHGNGRWEQTIEVGGITANTLTHATKDSMVIEPISPDHPGRIPQETIQAAERLKSIARNGRQSEIDVAIQPNWDLRPYRADRPDKPTASEFDTKHEQNMSNTISTSHPGNVYGETTKYRIRKLTERECFRLMGVEDADIDRIQSHRIRTTIKDGTVKEKAIPKSQQYKMAGNSIVVDNLFHIFRTMFIPGQPENSGPVVVQKSLFDI